MRPDCSQYIAWASIIFLAGCGAEFSPANPDNFIHHDFSVGQLQFSARFPPELQPIPSEVTGDGVVFANHDGRDRTINHLALSSSVHGPKADELEDELEMVPLESGAILAYGVFVPRDAGSGGPEQVLRGKLTFGPDHISVQCHAQAEWHPEPQWCIPFLHHITKVDQPKMATPDLIEATLAGRGHEVNQLLQQGTDPNLVYNTNTALTYAARDGFTEIARVLIDHGADVNWIDGEGVTPLILASFKNHLELVQLLLSHGADTTVKDQWDRTALDYALRRGEADPIVQLLQE